MDHNIRLCVMYVALGLAFRAKMSLQADRSKMTFDLLTDSILLIKSVDNKL